MITRVIYRELLDCAELIKESCGRFGEKVEEMKQLSTNETFKRNTKMRKNVNSIVESLALMSNLCALWNVGDAEMQKPIAEAVKSAVSLYRKRKTEKEFRFSNIVSSTLYNSEPINRMESVEDMARCKEEFNAFFTGIKSNKLALVPYILIDNATKYAKPDTPIAVKFNYVDENIGEIIFENMGPVINLDESVFDAGFRGENAIRLRENRGSGRGLAFAKSILEENGCSIEVEQVGEEERYDDIPYKLTRFKVTLNKEGICDNEQVEESDHYYQSIDSMFNHEYFNIKKILFDSDFRSIRESLYMHTVNVGLTEEIAEPLREAFAELEELKAQLLFVLSKYAYRNEAVVFAERIDVEWIKLYQETENLYGAKLEAAHIAIDSQVEIQRTFFGARYAANRLNLQAFRDQKKICNLEIVKDIPLLVYELILKLAGNPERAENANAVRITLSPGLLNGRYMWHNTIEIEAIWPVDLQTIQRVIEEEDPDTHVFYGHMSYVELLIRMLRKYVKMIRSPFDVRVNPYNNRVILRFSVSNDKW